MIRFTNVSKQYNGYNALSNINFHLAKGEMAFLTGHSGAGKTTLLKLILQIEKTQQGQVTLMEHNLGQISKRRIPLLRRQIGMVFQNPLLLPEQNVLENVSLPLHLMGFRSHEIKKRARTALEKVGLLSKEKLSPLALSSGEQQRVGIARAIVHKPPLLIADEPTGNLDPELSLEVMKLFEAFNAVGVTVLIATHDLALIATLNHRILLLKEGRLVDGGDA
jgi:cell division transport system ATP-binding protein